MLSFLFWMSLIPEQSIVVDLKNFQFIALQGFEIKRYGPASGGRRWCSDILRSCKTPIGEFKVLRKRGRFYRSPIYPLECGNPKEGKKPCAAMPLAIKFHYSGASFHASVGDDWGNLKHRSHGCIHLKLEDAAWIHNFVNAGTKIFILPY